MEVTSKTYGVYGLMDWQPLIKVGKATFSPLFTGGGATAYGQTPAKYTTNNPVCQRIIENSHYFKAGHIQLLYENKSESEVEEVKEEAKVTKMSFSSLGDASTYLNDTFGVPKTKLRSRDSIIREGMAHNVEISITE